MGSRRVRILAIASLVCLVLVGAGVGVRLLWLARRTRQAPELFAGLGLVLLILVGGPLAGVGRLPGWMGTPAGGACFAAGMLLTGVGVACLYAFTWRVFRPDSRLALAAFAVASGFALWRCLGLWRATAGLSSAEEILPIARPYAFTITSVVAGAFLWTAVESLLYWRPLRRRLALGLADPVVVNRLLLWGVSGLVVAGMVFQIGVRAQRGGLVLHDPVALATIACAGVVVGLAWWLAFLPPDRYLARVRRRAQAGA